MKLSSESALGKFRINEGQYIFISNATIQNSVKTVTGQKAFCTKMCLYIFHIKPGFNIKYCQVISY